MRIEDHWVEKEMEEIMKEKNNKNKNQINIKLFIFIIFAMASFCAMNFSSLHASTYNLTANDNGVTWVCNGCGKYCWSNTRDWKGYYYCHSCGKSR